jgi:hypothetical protein
MTIALSGTSSTGIALSRVRPRQNYLDSLPARAGAAEVDFIDDERVDRCWTNSAGQQPSERRPADSLMSIVVKGSGNSLPGSAMCVVSVPLDGYAR